MKALVVNEKLQQIFDGLPVDTLLNERQRVLEEITRLTERNDLIVRALGKKAVNEDS